MASSNDAEARSGVLPGKSPYIFNHPFSMVVSGPSMAGKTLFVRRLLTQLDVRIAPPPSRVIYCFSLAQPWFSKYPTIKFHRGFDESLLGDASSSSLDLDSGRTLIVLDDLMEQATHSQSIVSLFTEGVHHLSISIILIAQIFFHRSPLMRTITLNSQYIVLFRNPRDSSIAKKLSIQSNRAESKFVDAAYRDATREPYTYMLFDFSQATPSHLRYLSRVLGENSSPPIVYINPKTSIELTKFTHLSTSK